MPAESLIYVDPMPADAQGRLVDALEAGAWVAVKTESGWEAIASANNVVPLPSEGEDRPVVWLYDPRHAWRWAPNLAGAAMEFFRKVAPGPWNARISATPEGGRLATLPDPAKAWLAGDGKIDLRMPAQPLLSVLLGGDLVIAGVPVPPEETPEEWANRRGVSLAALVRPEIPESFGGWSTESLLPITTLALHVVGFEILRPGALSEPLLREGLVRHILFVCTGNTCRSPMAEAICKRLLAEHLGCDEADLPARGYRVESAGVAASPGSDASPAAIEVIRDRGGDLTGHLSQPITAEVLATADHVLAMTQSHLRLLQTVPLEYELPADVLSPEGVDVLDPIGGTLDDYRECASQIEDYIRRRLPEFFRA